jgi:2-polyprenyl-3-methyl-5-hydroxy-6-metoxy-1,4-benzoquinol methylase
MKQFWDERYSSEEYVYGRHANAFFQSRLEKLKPGSILLPGEGEGRNAVFAAEMGWSVYAFDTSIEGKKKALKLAEERDVSISYETTAYEDFSFHKKFDLIGLFFTHQASDIRRIFHHELIKYLNPGGLLIMEAFSKNQIRRNTGGPGNLDFLFSKQELLEDFSELEKVLAIDVCRILDEGFFHQGEADVIQLVLKKQF